MDIYGKNGVPKVKENALSAMVGMGVMLAAFGQPLMTKSPGQLALAQGRRPRAFSQSAGADGLEENSGAEKPQPSQPQPPQQQQEEEKGQPTAGSIMSPQESGRSTPGIKDEVSSPKSISESGSPHASVSGMSVSTQNTIHRNHVVTSPSLEDLRGGQAFKLKRDRFPSPRYSHDTAPSSPISLVHSDRSSMDGRSSTVSMEMARRSYFHSEMQFLLALVDIATRLVIVPKPARLSALRAELTLLNHNLPAEICVPLWCHATVEKPHHHRVVRIPPQDAVVLNSADRVCLLCCYTMLSLECHVRQVL